MNNNKKKNTSSSLEYGVRRDDDETAGDVTRYPQRHQVAPVPGVDGAVAAERSSGRVQPRQEEDDGVGHVAPQRPELVERFLQQWLVVI